MNNSMFKDALTEDRVGNLQFNPDVIETVPDYNQLMQAVDQAKDTKGFGDLDSAAELAHEISEKAEQEEIKLGYSIRFDDAPAESYFQDEVMPAVEKADPDVEDMLVLADEDSQNLMEKVYVFGVGVRSGIVDAMDDRVTEIRYDELSVSDDIGLDRMTAVSEVLNFEYDRRDEVNKDYQAFDYGMTAGLLHDII